MDKFIAITKALAVSNRIRALMALRGGELCVCQIIELLGLAPSTVSKHMSVLKQAGLVCCRKHERWMYYRLPEKNMRTKLIEKTLQWVVSSLEKTDTAMKDESHLARITKQDLSHLCKLQRTR